jgi:hypothetical protein
VCNANNATLCCVRAFFFPCGWWQRITEVAGVVVSFDPKPIPVTIISFLAANVSGCLNNVAVVL